MKTYRTTEQALAEWDEEVETEKNLGDPRFVLKHALRLQGLFLNEENEITNANGRLYAYLGTAVWKDENILEATIKRVDALKFVMVTVDISQLRKS